MATVINREHERVQIKDVEKFRAGENTTIWPLRSVPTFSNVLYTLRAETVVWRWSEGRHLRQTGTRLERDDESLHRRGDLQHHLQRKPSWCPPPPHTLTHMTPNDTNSFRVFFLTSKSNSFLRTFTLYCTVNVFKESFHSNCSSFYYTSSFSSSRIFNWNWFQLYTIKNK